MKVRDVVRTKVRYAEAMDNLAEVAQKAAEETVDGVVVLKRGRPAGLVTFPKLISESSRPDLDPQNVPLQDVMTPGIIICNLDDEASEAAEWMRFRRVKWMLAVDSSMTPKGFLTLDAVEDAQDRKMETTTGEGANARSSP